jgi:hypothetical protein
MRPAAGSRLVVSLGYRGTGHGVARVVARSDGAPPLQLAEQRVSGGDGAAWIPLQLDLTPVAGRVVRLELQAASDSAQGQVAFGDPHVLRDRPPHEPARTSLALIVVASGLHRELLPPFPDSRPLVHLTELQRGSLRFSGHRAPATASGSVVASLITGLSPTAHGMRTGKARLPPEAQTLADLLARRSGESAFFSGVPTTRAVFGFREDFTRFEEHSPVNDVSAHQPLVDARKWLDERLGQDPETPRLVVAHVRGGHPPWDLSREEVARLEPREYHGLLEARRGGMILSSIRSRGRLSQRRLSTPDWTRLRALQSAALEKQDAAFGDLRAMLERRGAWQSALIVFLGDVASGDPPVAPFGGSHGLSEEHLLTPLWVKVPGAGARGDNVDDLVSAADVARTVADALGLELPADPRALNLEALAAGDRPPLDRVLMAESGAAYSLRWGQWLLEGESPGAPRLCDLGVDPTCAYDVLEQEPIAAEALWREAFAEHRRQRALDVSGGTTQPALLDEATAAALQVWGD